jgi:hypothetical protein
MLYPNSTPTATQPSQLTEFDSALNSKRPDGESVKETYPPSKFLGICTTIQGHDLFTSPINKTVRARSFFHQAFSIQIFANSSLLFQSPAQPQKPMAGSSNRRRAADEAKGSRAGARRRQ